MHWFGTDKDFTYKSFLLGGASLLAGSYISSRIMPVLSGSGIPRTKILLAVHHGVINTKEWVMKIVATMLSLASGIPLGSEGPTIAISAGIGSTLGRKFRFNEKQIKSLVYAGCSAGIAAAFNTPIAAVIFTLEEIVGNVSAKSMGPILISSLVASVTAAALIGQNSIFTPVHYTFNANWKELGFYIALGIVAGYAGPLFTNSIVFVKKITNRFIKQRMILVAFSFILVGLLSQIVKEVPGNGLPVINRLLQGEIDSMEILAMLLIFKFVASAVCNGAGISGGILLPVLFIGAALGGLFGSISTYTLGIKQMEIGAYCLVGMGAFFASVIRTPFASIVLVFEMTRDYRIILPLMLANLIAYFIAERVDHGTFYDKMAYYDGYELPGHEEDDYLHHVFVDSVYTRQDPERVSDMKSSEYLYTDHNLSYAFSKLKRGGMNKALKVVNRMDPGTVIGEISLQQVMDHILRDQNPNP
jgi:CIC family chloride channel protein